MSIEDKSWQSLSAHERAREYSPSSCIGGDYRPFVAQYRQLSDAAKSQCNHMTLSYGPKSSNTIDIFLPRQQEKPSPLLVFYHGGYWQELSKLDSAFPASHCVEQGFAYACVDYTLSPAASIAEIVLECEAALAALIRSAPSLNIDQHRIVVSGSSAGAHLAAMTNLLWSCWNNSVKLAGAVLVSGVYDLRPLVGTAINDALGLDLDTAAASSPAMKNLQGFAPSIVTWGDIETNEFKRQSRQFADALNKAGSACECFEIPGRNHFDVILDLATPGTRLGDAVAKLVAGTTE